MFYVLSKTLDLLVAPLTWALALVLLGAIAAHRGRRVLAVRSLLSAIAVLSLFSTGPVSHALVRAVESAATTTMPTGASYDVVVVLGGIIGAGSTPETPDFSEGVDRLLAGYDLVRQDRARAILVSSSPPEASTLATQLLRWGVAPDRIVIDDRSRNTRDNAVQSARIVRERGWSRVLLVTSALHMPRAAGCFRAAGVTFDTLVVDRLAPSGDTGLALGPRADALALSTQAIREAFGRVVYRVVGYAR